MSAFIHGKYNLGLSNQFFKRGFNNFSFLPVFMTRETTSVWCGTNLVNGNTDDLIQDVTIGKALPVSHFRTRQ